MKTWIDADMNILLIRLSSLGDIVLTEPIVGQLRSMYPQANIHYLVKPVFAEVVKSFPAKLEVILWNNDLASLLKLSSMKFDLVIDLHNKPNTFLIRMFAAGKKNLVYKKQHSLRRKIVKKKTERSISSTLELYYTVFGGTAEKEERPFPVLQADDSAVELLRKHQLQECGYIMIFPGATSYTKRWKEERFAELIEMLKGQQIVLSGSGAEAETIDKIVSLTSSEVVNLCAKTSIKELISLISNAKAVVCNDSGPAHLAAALQKPQVTIFGATSPRLGFAPLNKNGVIVSQNLECSPCSLHGSEACPLGHFNCMEKISAKEVYEELKKKK